MQVEPVWIGRPHDSSVVVVADGPIQCSVAEERKVDLLVISYGEGIVRRVQKPPVAVPAVVFDPRARPRVVRILIRASHRVRTEIPGWLRARCARIREILTAHY